MSVGALILLFSLFITTGNRPNCWRGIRPLQSTCEDVKRILKVQSCTLPISQYTLTDFRVMVEFQDQTCLTYSDAWNVPKGTTIAITISPRTEMSPSDFGVDISKYKKRADAEIVGVEHYDSAEEGVSIDLYRGFVQNLFLYPRSSDEKLRCKHSG